MGMKLKTLDYSVPSYLSLLIKLLINCPLHNPNVIMFCPSGIGCKLHIKQ